MTTSSVGRTAPTPAATTASSTRETAKDLLQPDGSFKLTDELKNEAGMGGFLKGLGSAEQSLTRGVEKKMAEWAKSHPGADAAAFKDQLKKTLMSDGMAYNNLQKSIQRMQDKIMSDMKEAASDRFG
ncbi:hypothetical protein SAMN05444354_101789 [Stigmatella aurantiaca]|uniref:Uncharacterized protein n=1 Tax=Stigmatella aurantiaca TaxID=41 RepID=A0A1H7HQI7_STIAU|nr:MULTISPECIES: hypothetical protein [Stigmatella]SEK52551.1 hypothetical protein SAMN05444354_101789 [Stigmatella aurantiaca]